MNKESLTCKGKSMKQYAAELDMYTDGSYRPPHHGAYAAYLSWQGKFAVIYEAVPHSTIGRMELMAVVSGLESLIFPCKVNLFCDSQYVVFTMQKGWIWNWARKGWLTSTGAPVKHRDLMERLLKQLSIHTVVANWVPGHKGVWQNEICDTFAQAETMKMCG